VVCVTYVCVVLCKKCERKNQKAKGRTEGKKRVDRTVTGSNVGQRKRRVHAVIATYVCVRQWWQCATWQ